MSPINFLDNGLAQVFLQTTRDYERVKNSRIAFLCIVLEIGPEKILESAREDDVEAETSKFFQAVLDGDGFTAEELLANPEFAVSVKLAFNFLWNIHIDKPIKNQPKADAIDIVELMENRLHTIFGYKNAKKIAGWLMNQILHGDPDTTLVSDKELRAHRINLEQMYFGHSKEKVKSVNREESNHDSQMIPCPKCGKEKRVFPNQTKRFKCPCGFSKPWPFE